MFVYATKALGLSEHEAYLRIAVARAARQAPDTPRDAQPMDVFTLSGIARLAPLLTEANRESVLARAVGMSKREIEELVAELSPKEDIPATIRKLPERRQKTKPTRSLQLVPERVDVSTANSAERPNGQAKEKRLRRLPLRASRR